MNTQKRKYITILTLFCLLISLFAGTTSFAFARESKYEYTNVTDDLLSAENFSVYDYPTNPYGEIELINFVEYGYSANGNHDYGLYVYIYNPRQLEFSELPTANKIQLSVGNGTYKKYPLKFLSKSSNYNDFVKERLYYKFKIEGANDLLSQLDKEARIYNISGIELLEIDKQTAKEYHVGGKYTVTGYAKGYGLNSSAESTLNQSITNLRTLKLDVHSAIFRTPPIQKDHQNQLNSVYFAVPNDILKSYGNLQKIQAEWYEYKTAPIIVADNTLYESLSPHMGVTVNGQTQEMDKPRLSYGFTNSQDGTTTLYDWTYNMNLNSFNKTKENCTKLDYIFKADGDVLKYNVTDDTLKNYIYNYNKAHDKGYIELKNQRISADLFQDTVDSGRTKGYNNVTIDAGDKFNMLGYDSTNPWWKKYQDYGWFNKPEGLGKDFKDIAPIYQVKDTDLNNVINNLLVDSEYVDDFVIYYNNQKLVDKTTFIFRFAVTDYFSTNLSSSIGKGYIAEESVFLDFDILSLTFEKEGKYINIPVVANPIDVVGGITPPPELISIWEKIAEWLKNNWQWIVLALVILLCLPFLPNILLFVFKLLVAIIKLPFVLVKKTYELCKQKALKREQANNINALQAIQDLERYEARTEAQQSKPKAKRKRKRTNNST